MLTLRALQTSANNQGVESPVTWDAINQFGRQYGAPDIDYDRFAARWDSDPILQQLVARFDSQGVVVKTKKHSAQPGQTSDAASPSLVSQMAKHATSRALG